MEIHYTKEEGIQFIKTYYKNVENKDVEVSYKSSKVLTGSYMCDSYGCETKLSITFEEEILGIKTKIEDSVEEDKLIDIFNEIFKNYNYSVDKARFDDGLSGGSYRMGEFVPGNVYCNGIILTVRTIGKQKTIGGK